MGFEEGDEVDMRRSSMQGPLCYHALPHRVGTAEVHVPGLGGVSDNPHPTFFYVSLISAHFYLAQPTRECSGAGPQQGVHTLITGPTV